jgi:hypothetical protein
VPGLEGPSPDEPMLPFQAADPTLLRRRMEEAEVRDVSIEHDVESLECASGQQLWDWMMASNPIPGALTADLTHEQRAQVRAVLDRRLRSAADACQPRSRQASTSPPARDDRATTRRPPGPVVTASRPRHHAGRVSARASCRWGSTASPAGSCPHRPCMGTADDDASRARPTSASSLARLGGCAGGATEGPTGGR